MRLLLLLFLIPAISFAQSKDEAAVTAAVEKLRKALVDPTEANLKAITSPALTYGHSNGLLEDQKAFIQALVSDESNFTAITLANQTVKVEGNVAWVRHNLQGDTHNKGKDPGKVNLSVLLVFTKVKGEWILLARQAVKLA